jgi:hypothetical protein
MSQSAVEGPREASRALAEFREALLELSDVPTKANIVRYLNASRALDGAPLEGPRPRRGRRNGPGSSK